MSARRLIACLTLVAGAICVLLVPTSAEPARAAADPATSGSAVTVKGTGAFADLSVTVSQTEHLINQVVDVTWTGGTQTAPVTGNFNANYLQIMQCWGDGPAPERENCQFGGLVGDTRGGSWVTARQVSYGSSLVDPLETYRQEPGSFDPKNVPFASVTGVTTEDSQNQFFDAYSTNEIPFARTHADGTGEEHFEIQTAREAPGLGCGARLDGGKVRDCWLVVVPRDDLEVDGQPARQRLESSPLSATNWKSRIAVPLDFDPVGLACPIGTPERRLVGQEEVADAVSRWQPVLCDVTGSIFGFSQIPDDLARNQALTDDPWLSIVTDPVDPALVPEGRELVYAPVAVSGIGLAFNIDRVPAYGAPDAVRERSGTRVESIRLTPRLVAKLLTQSYKGASLAPDTLGDNPPGLAKDPEFVALNPEFSELDIRGLASITVPVGQADAYRELWRWVASDARARIFLEGDADPWGMVVNPVYRDLALERADFPVSDLACRAGDGNVPDLCPLDYLAYASDMHEAGRAAAKGSTLSRSTYSFDSGGGWKLSPPQLSGSRAVLALVDTATAERYRLPMASLQTGVDTFVAPDQESLAGGLAAMTPGPVEGVLQANPDPDEASAYPLTHISYATTTPAELSDDEATAYSRLLTYVATDGQTVGLDPGKLPPGYLPLTDALRTQTLAVADQVAGDDDGGGGGGESEEPTPTPSSTPTDGTPTPGLGAGPVGGPTPPLPSGPAAESPSASGPADPTVAVASFTTPAAPVGPRRLTLAAVLIAVAALVVARPLVGRLGGRRAH